VIDPAALTAAIGAEVGRPATDPAVVRASDVAVQLVAIDVALPEADLPADDPGLFSGLVLVGAGVFINPPASNSEITASGDTRFNSLFAPADLIEAHSSYWQHLRPDLGAS
jgi:hypothetical protein